ncbi:MAG: DMT family transporter [Bdellovibrionota bacterium]
MDSSSSALPTVLLFVLFWALEIFSTKLGFLAGAKVLPYTVQCSLTAFVVLACWTIPRERARLKELFFSRRRLFLQISVANLIHYFFGTIFYMLGVSMTSAMNIGFLVSLSTPMNSILAWVILNEPIRRSRGLLLFLLIAGAYILATNLRTLVPHEGDLLIAAAAFCWALGNVLMRRAIKGTDVSGDVVSFLKPPVGLPFFLLASLFGQHYLGPTSVFAGDPFSDFSCLRYAMLAGLFAALLWIFLYRALKVAQSAYVSMIGLATPVLVSLLAFTFLDERLSPVQIFGASLILVAGFMTHWTARKGVH